MAMWTYRHTNSQSGEAVEYDVGGTRDGQAVGKVEESHGAVMVVPYDGVKVLMCSRARRHREFTLRVRIQQMTMALNSIVLLSLLLSSSSMVLSGVY